MSDVVPPAVLFAALADPIRCRIVELLRDEPLPVHRIALAFPVSRPAISRHLRILRQSGLVGEERHGRENRYRLETAQLAVLVRWLAPFWDRGGE
jgi:DNA-binding transcriptional ArsR family regulator